MGEQPPASMPTLNQPAPRTAPHIAPYSNIIPDFMREGQEYKFKPMWDQAPAVPPPASFLKTSTSRPASLFKDAYPPASISNKKTSPIPRHSPSPDKGFHKRTYEDDSSKELSIRERSSETDPSRATVMPEPDLSFFSRVWSKFGVMVAKAADRSKEVIRQIFAEPEQEEHIIMSSPAGNNKRRAICKPMPGSFPEFPPGDVLFHPIPAEILHALDPSINPITNLPIDQVINPDDWSTNISNKTSATNTSSKISTTDAKQSSTNINAEKHIKSPAISKSKVPKGATSAVQYGPRKLKFKLNDNQSTPQSTKKSTLAVFEEKPVSHETKRRSLTALGAGSQPQPMKKRPFDVFAKDKVKESDTSTTKEGISSPINTMRIITKRVKQDSNMSSKEVTYMKTRFSTTAWNKPIAVGSMASSRHAQKLLRNTHPHFSPSTTQVRLANTIPNKTEGGPACPFSGGPTTNTYREREERPSTSSSNSSAESNNLDHDSGHDSNESRKEKHRATELSMTHDVENDDHTKGANAATSSKGKHASKNNNDVESANNAASSVIDKHADNRDTSVDEANMTNKQTSSAADSSKPLGRRTYWPNDWDQPLTRESDELDEANKLSNASFDTSMAITMQNLKVGDRVDLRKGSNRKVVDHLMAGITEDETSAAGLEISESRKGVREEKEAEELEKQRKAEAEAKRKADQLKAAKEARKKAEDDALKQRRWNSLFKNPTPDQMKRISDIIYDKTIEDKTEYRLGLRKADLITLVPRTTWLNDEIINTSLTDLVKRAQEKRGWTKSVNGPAPPYHNMATQWWVNVKAKGVRSVLSWNRRSKMDKLLTVERLLIPICDGAHWRLIVVSGTEKTVSYYDSLNMDPQPYVGPVYDWVKATLGSAFDANEWRIIEGQQSPRQSNGSDCGVLTLLNARAVALGLDIRPNLYQSSTERILDVRHQIAAQLLSGGLDWE